jgi:hypothetical protein
MELKAPVKGKSAKGSLRREKCIELWTHDGNADHTWDFGEDGFAGLADARKKGAEYIENFPGGAYQIVTFTLGSQPRKK